MDKFLGSRIGRKRLHRSAWWYHKCSVHGCTIPLWPAGENIDEDGCDMRGGGDMASKGLSFSQICFLCNTVLCRYHLSPPIDFAERWSYDFQQLEFHPPVACLCASCIIKVDIEFTEFENEQLLQSDSFSFYQYQREYSRRRRDE